MMATDGGQPVALLLRKLCEITSLFVGELLRTVRLIGQQTFSEEAFEEGLHTVSSEPYFRDTSYKCPALKEVTVVANAL